MKFGQIEIQPIVELQTGLMPMMDLMQGLTAEIFAAERPALERDGSVSSDGLIVLALRSFVVRTPDHNIIVDTGLGNDKDVPFNPAWGHKQDTVWMDGLAAAGLTPEQVDMVICTHLHVDHVGWNTRLEGGRWVPTFPNARYVFERTEYEFWAAEHEKQANPVFRESVLPVMQAGVVELVEPSATIAPGVSFMPTPGHTPGHCAVVLGDGAAVIAGDVLHSTLQFAHPDISPRFDSDPAQASRTRQAFLEQFAGTPTAIYFSHPPVAPITVLRDGSRFAVGSP